MTNKELLLNNLEQRIVDARKEILSHIEFAASHVERASVSYERGHLQSAGNEVLNIGRNSIDLAKALATLDELENAHRFLKA